MKKDSIVHMVGFITAMGYEDFAAQWDIHARLATPQPYPVLLREETQARPRYPFISMHPVKNEQVNFIFMKGRSAEYFPDQKVKVIHLGGYQLVSPQQRRGEDPGTARLLVFKEAATEDTDYSRELPYCRRVHTYEAFYENCLYNRIVELLIPFSSVQDAVEKLKKIPGLELSVYRETLIPQS